MWLVTSQQHRRGEMDCHIWAIDGALFLRSVVRSLADRGKNYALSPIRWDALSSFPLTAFPKDAGDQTVPIDVADSLYYFRLNLFRSRGFYASEQRVCRFLSDPNHSSAKSQYCSRGHFVIDSPLIPTHKGLGFSRRI
jgi:hypothetical protein